MIAQVNGKVVVMILSGEYVSNSFSLKDLKYDYYNIEFRI